MSSFRGHRWYLAIALFLFTGATADDWPGPQVREAFSASREYFVRILPGESWGDTRGFAGAKKGKYAIAEFYRRERNRSYTFVTETALANPVAPVDFFVSDHGYLATLDNWHNLGYGKVVTLYGPGGRLIRAYALTDLFLPKEIESFSHSVSSVRWRDGPAYIRPDQKTVLVTVKANDGASLVFGLESGEYKYCEYQGGNYRCRAANADREWLPNGKMSLQD